MNVYTHVRVKLIKVMFNFFKFQCWPIFYILMSDKKASTYVEVFQFLERNCMRLNPSSFMTDFETAMRNALRRVYGAGIRIRGCWFHYTQAVRRRCASIADMFRSLNADKEANNLYNRFLVLPLVPENKIVEAYHLLKSEADQFGTLFDDFLDYFDRQWIVRVSNNKDFAQIHNIYFTIYNIFCDQYLFVYLIL